MAPGVRDRLAHDADERLALVRGDLRALTYGDAELNADTAGDLFGGLHEGDLERLVDRARQRGDRPARLVERPFGSGRELSARLGDDVREFLRDPVVDLTGDPAALLQHRHRGEPPPVAADLARGPGQQDETEQEPQEVPGEDPVRIERGKEEVVEAGEGRECGAGGEPAHELVAV